MILGIGNDLANIERLRATLNRFGKRFTERVFTPIEREKAQSRKDQAAFYAKRFAAKEAVLKALGTGFAKGISWQDMSVENTADGKPFLVLSGMAAQHLDAMTPTGFRAQVDLSLTDEPPLAQAFVVISACPSDWPKVTGET